jgi:hypothetical protein
MRKIDSGVELLLDEMIVQFMAKRYSMILTFEDAAGLLGKLIEERGICVTKNKSTKKGMPSPSMTRWERFWGGTVAYTEYLELRGILVNDNILKVLIGTNVLLYPLPKNDYQEKYDNYRKNMMKNTGVTVFTRMTNKKWSDILMADQRNNEVMIIAVDDNECAISHPSFWCSANINDQIIQHAMWIPMWFLTGECWK